MDLTQIRKDLAVAGTDRDAVLRLQQALPPVLNKFEHMLAEEKRAVEALEEIAKANEEFETAELEDKKEEGYEEPEEEAE